MRWVALFNRSPIRILRTPLLCAVFLALVTGSTGQAAPSPTPHASSAANLHGVIKHPQPHPTPAKSVVKKNVASKAKTGTPPPKSAIGSTAPFPQWLTILLALIGGAALTMLGRIALGRSGTNKGGQPGAALLTTLPIMAAIGFIIVPFAPGLGDGRWIPVDYIGAAILVGGGLLGFIYGLPVVDADALKAAGATSGTFERPSTKLEKLSDSLITAFTGGFLTYVLTQGSKFNTFFLAQTGLGPGNFSSLLGIAMLFYFAPIGFVLTYSLTATVGALAFKRAAESLVLETAIIKSFPPMPDLPDDPSPEEIAAAKAIAARPYGTLSGSTDKAAWARAQALLQNFHDATAAFQDAIVLDPRNPALLVDYAVTIYNNPAIDNIPLVLGMLDQAEAIAGPQASIPLQQRMRALRAAAKLYVPGQYEDVVVAINDWIRSAIPTTRFARYYRACGFGQFYESCALAALPAASPYVTLPAADADRLKALVHADVAITLVAGEEKGLESVRMVIDPNSPLRIRPRDCDLQMLAADDAVLSTQAGLTTPPPPPGAPRPPLPGGIIPNPLTSPAGTLAAWIVANCPP